MDISDGGAPPLPKIGSLDLSSVRENRNGGTTKFGLSGDHELGFSGRRPDVPALHRSRC